MSSRSYRSSLDEPELRGASLRRLSGSERSDIEVAPRVRRSYSSSAREYYHYREPGTGSIGRSGKERSRSRIPAKPPLKHQRRWWQHGLLLTLFLCGPVGTLLSFVFLLPSEPKLHRGVATANVGDGDSGGRIKMVHLQLSGTNRRARFVLDQYTLWGAFLAGVRDRLQCGHIRRVTDSSGEAILAVADMVDHDHIIIHADWSEVGGGVGEEHGELGRRHISRDGAADKAGPDRDIGRMPVTSSLNATVAGVDMPSNGLRKKTRTSVPKLLEKLKAFHMEGQSPGTAAGVQGATSDQYVARDAMTDTRSERGSQGTQILASAGEPSSVTPTAAVDPLGDPEQPAERCGERHPQYRIAMVVPWVNELPPWVSYFALTAHRSRSLIDWLIFHETLTPPNNLPDNVRFIDLGVGGLSQLFGLRLGDELNMPVRNASLLIRSMRFMLDKWPRLVAEYKPAFGAIFEQYLTDYTHWGYCDLDIVIGNLPLFIEDAELAGQDIVTYSFGDMDALYLRGQWTMHRNLPEISMLWKNCPHLGDELQKELLMKVAWVRRMESRGVKNYPKRFQSAEGCYSHRASLMPGVRIKMAHKQFVGLSVPADEVIFSVNNAVWQCPRGVAVDLNELHQHSQQECTSNLPGVQEPLGEMLPLQVSSEGGCGKWMPAEYRMCAMNLPEPPDRERDTIGFNTYLKDGQFYAQRFRSTLPILDNGCKQGAFFHMQEWKKIWGYGTHGVDPLELALARDTPPSFSVSTGGITLLS
mmetsp:Transcript_12056/g.34709  ORF Transcript_12056/g.34709 Transcript_12056/m.34709 type:complete len:755 (-) Transcript_12056:286-2550(-)